jgi:amidase
MAQWKSEQGIAVNTSQFNLVGNPAMTVPIGFLPDLSLVEADPNVKLPVGMQLIGRLHGEMEILKIGYAFEKMYDWQKG